MNQKRKYNNTFNIIFDWKHKYLIKQDSSTKKIIWNLFVRPLTSDNRQNASPPPHSSLHFAPCFASAKPYYSLQLGKHLHQRIARKHDHVTNWRNLVKIANWNHAKVPRSRLHDERKRVSPPLDDYRFTCSRSWTPYGQVFLFLLKEATKGSKVICYYSCYSYLRKCGLLRRRPIVFGGRAEAGSKRKGCPLSSAKFTNLFTVGCEINRTRISRRKFDGHLVNCESLRGSFSTWLTVMRFNLSSSGMIFEGMKMDFWTFCRQGFGPVFGGEFENIKGY